MLEIKLLGQFEVLHGGLRVSIPTRNAQSLLAYLTINSAQTHRREKLAGLLWPDSSDENARSNLRHELWRLRKACDREHSHIISNELSIAFRPTCSARLDVHALEQPPLDSCSIDDLADSLAVYHGELLPGFFDEWVLVERQRVQAVFERRIARLLELLENEHRWAEVLEWGQRWIGQGRWPEAAYRALMQAHAASGDVAKAAGLYERLAKGLRKDLGVKPSAQTNALYRQLKSGGQPAAVPASQPQNDLVQALALSRTRRSNLPHELTSFIGREKEIQDVARLVVGARLVTITGSGGVGKTRLAIQAADTLAASLPGGVWWVELSPLFEIGASPAGPGGNAASLVTQAVAKVLHVPETPDQHLLDSLVDYLQEQALLLVLDNCEHLITACAVLAEHLLTRCHRLTILATSRESLGVPGELIYLVHPLTDPAEAEQLFRERAAAAQPVSAPPLPLDPRLVAYICRQLDGIPLAIELAAARTRLLSLEQIAARIDNTFRLLDGDSRTRLPGGSRHHQTLRTAIDWSYNLLTGKERRLFAHLSIFAGSWTLEAAESVCTDSAGHHSDRLDYLDILGLLASLASKSMITVHHNPAAAQVRYAMLETIRQYAQEKLLETETQELLQARFVSYYLDFAEQASAGLHGPEQKSWLTQLAQEMNNMRLALDRAFSAPGMVEQGAQLTGTLCSFWLRSSNASEMVAWREKLLAVCAVQPLTRRLSKALSQIGLSMLRLFSLIDESLVILPTLQAGAAILRDAGPPDQVEYARMNLVIGCLLLHTQRLSEGRALVDESIAILRQSGDPAELGQALDMAAFRLYFFHRDPQALAWFGESVNLLRLAGDRWALGLALSDLGRAAYWEGETNSAARYLKESLEINREGGLSLAMYNCLVELGEVARSQGDYNQARTFYRQALALLEQMGVSPSGPAANWYWIVYGNLGFVELYQGNVAQGLAYFHLSIPNDRKKGPKVNLVWSLACIGAVAAVSGRGEDAARLLGAQARLMHQLASENPNINFLYEGPVDRLEIDRYISLTQSQLDPDQYAAAWQAGQQMDLDQSLAYADSLFLPR